jgi:hypothetical protein
LNPPVLILGEGHGVGLGLRQQRRAVPLQTTEVGGCAATTPAAVLRIKAVLLAERRSLRDFGDLAALASDLAGSSAAAMSVGNGFTGCAKNCRWRESWRRSCRCATPSDG